MATIILFPFVKILEKIAIAAVPDRKAKGELVILDDRLLLAPSFAIAECYRQSIKMAEMVEFNFVNSTKMLKSYHKNKAEQILANETKIDMYEDKLNSFMIKLSAKEVSEEDNARVSQLMLVIGDY